MELLAVSNAHGIFGPRVSRKYIQDDNVRVPLNIPLLPELLNAVLLTSACRPVLFVIARHKEEHGDQRNTVVNATISAFAILFL